MDPPLRKDFVPTVNQIESLLAWSYWMKKFELDQKEWVHKGKVHFGET